MFDEYAQKLEELRVNVPKVFERVAGKGANHFVKVAQGLTTANKTVDTGNYRRNWEAVSMETKPGEWNIVCSNPVEYASFLEDGYEIKNAHFVPFDKMEGTKKTKKLIREFKSKYSNAKGFIAKPRRFKGLKIGLQAKKDTRSWTLNELGRMIKLAFYKRYKMSK